MRVIQVRKGRDPRARSRWAALRRLCMRLLVVAFAVVLLTPASVELLLSRPATPSENRRLASWPAAPRSLNDAQQLPARISAYIEDHFGLRYKMIAAHNRLRYALFHELPTRQVLEGRHHRLFLTSHSRHTPYALIRDVCGLGVDDPEIAAAARSATVLIDHLRTKAPSSLLLVVPTSPVIYPEDLPGWLGRPCARAVPTGVRAEASLPAAVRSAWAYPLQQELRLKRSMQVYPPAYFHWFGAAPRRLVESIAEHRLGLVKQVDVPAAMQPVGSDLGQFTAGLRFTSSAALPDWRRAGIDACIGSKCFPELGDIAPLLYDLSRYRNPNAGGAKLLVLSDSFGLHAAGYFSEYVGEVWHLSMDNIGRLSPDQINRFKQVVFGDYDPDVIVGIFHDGALLGGLRGVTGTLWPGNASGTTLQRDGETDAISR
jgi:hypothetical protein